MSALATPMISSPNVSNPMSSGNSEPVNAEFCKTFTETTIPDTANSSSTPKYAIVFDILSTDGQPKSVKWIYDDEATRDADTLLVEAVIVTSI